MAGNASVGAQSAPSGAASHGAPRLRFVASDEAGLPVKRKQVQHACLACRQRKKKCNHGPHTGDSQSLGALREPKRRRHGVDTTATPSSSSSVADEDATTAAAHLLHLCDQAGTAPAEAPEEDPQARFVGDLNPENVFISAMAEVSRGSPSSRHHRDSSVGIWAEPVSPDRNSRTTSRKPLPSSALNSKRMFPEPRNATAGDELATLEEALRTTKNIWLERCLTEVDPTPAAFSGLRTIYLKKIQPIFPIFDEKRLMNLGSSRIDRAIKLVISLAAATDHEAKPHLLLRFSSAVLSYHEFSSKVASLLRTLIQEIDFTNRLLDQIRIMSAMALYWQPQEEQDWDGPARLFSQAMAIVFSIGLHLEVYDKAYHIHDQRDETPLPAGQPPRQKCREDIERIFLCIFAVDRMIASFHGRPILLNERDFDRDILKYAAMQAPVFRLFILVIWQLNLVQDLYRPFTPSSHSADVSVFERCILEAGAQNAPPSLIATLEVFHHAVCALSVRQTRQTFATPPPDPDGDKQREYPHLPQPQLNARRSIAADRILQIVKQYDVGPMPFIPYALSISLSIAYRKWRFSQVPMFRARGRDAFLEVLPVLEKWGCVFTSARINYNLAQKVVEGMEKVQDNIKRKCRSTPETRVLQNGATTATASRATPDQAGNAFPELPTKLGTNVNGASITVARPAAHSAGSNSTVPAFAAGPDSQDVSFNYDFAFPDDLGAGLDLFNFFDQSANMDVGEMDSMFDRNLDPMAPAFWPAYPSLDPERTEQGASFFP